MQEFCQKILRFKVKFSKGIIVHYVTMNKFILSFKVHVFWTTME